MVSYVAVYISAYVHMILFVLPVALFPLSYILSPAPSATSLWRQADRTAIAEPAYEEQVCWREGNEGVYSNATFHLQLKLSPILPTFWKNTLAVMLSEHFVLFNY